MLDGLSENGSAVRLLSNNQLAFVPSVPLGSRVARGQEVGRTRINPDVRAALESGAAASRLDRGQLAHLRTLVGPVIAPISGVLGNSAEGPIVRAPGVDVVVDLLPIQYLRYQALAFSGRASIETIIGQRVVACAAVWVQPGSGSAYALRCRLPSYVETAAGLRAQVMLRSERFENVVVVPNLFVEYVEAIDGYAINVVVDGEERRVPITVGATNGVVRIVTSKVPIGAELVPPDDA